MPNVVSLNARHAGVKTPRRSFLAVKRVLDVVFSLILLIVLLPIELAVAVVSAIDTKSSPLFIQTRMGRNNRPFKCLKFRTMSADAPQNVATRDLEAQKYISRTGGILRKLSLDELPQLWNILKGDMSFVGPRPIVLTEEELLRLRRLHGADTVRPGLTGWAQIHGRDNVRVAQKAFMDGYYARHATFVMDLKILVKTVKYVLTSEGVVEGHSTPAPVAVENRRTAS